MRYVLAVAGGLLITVAILIAMSQFAAMFRERDGDRFFLIDVLEAPDRGRPTRPAAAALPPERNVDRLTDSAPILSPETTIAPAANVPAEAAAPDLDLAVPATE